MLTGLDANWLRVAGYAAAAVAAVVAGWREHRRADDDAGAWPAFWFAAAAVFGLLAVGRATEVGELVSRFGRRLAHTEGWYDRRRGPQELVIAAVTGLSLLGVVVAFAWVGPERRRRHLSTALVVFGLVAYAAVRMVSLHDVDALLRHREVGGLTLGAGAELAGIVLAIALALWPAVGGPSVTRWLTAEGPSPGHSRHFPSPSDQK